MTEKTINLSDTYVKKTEHPNITATNLKLCMVKIDSHGHIVDYDDVLGTDLPFTPTTDLWQGAGDIPTNVNDALNKLIQLMFSSGPEVPSRPEVPSGPE